MRMDICDVAHLRQAPDGTEGAGRVPDLGRQRRRQQCLDGVLGGRVAGQEVDVRLLSPDHLAERALCPGDLERLVERGHDTRRLRLLLLRQALHREADTGVVPSQLGRQLAGRGIGRGIEGARRPWSESEGGSDNQREDRGNQGPGKHRPINMPGRALGRGRGPVKSGSDSPAGPRF